VPERNTEVFEMLIGQVGETAISMSFSANLAVLGHSELVEPVRNLLHRGHQRRRRG
jgi:hypothetical protein